MRTNTARLTCIARTATYTPGEGRTAISPRRLPSYSDTTNFRQQPSACARRGESIRANLAHRFAFYPPLSVTFRCRRRSRQRIEASFRLAHALQLVLRLTVIARIRMRPNRLLPPNTFFRLRAPAPRAFPMWQSRDFRLALFGGPSVSRRPIRFGGSCGLVSRGAFSSPSFSTGLRTVPLAPLSPPRF